MAIRKGGENHECKKCPLALLKNPAISIYSGGIIMRKKCCFICILIITLFTCSNRIFAESEHGIELIPADSDVLSDVFVGSSANQAAIEKRPSLFKAGRFAAIFNQTAEEKYPEMLSALSDEEIEELIDYFHLYRDANEKGDLFYWNENETVGIFGICGDTEEAGIDQAADFMWFQMHQDLGNYYQQTLQIVFCTTLGLFDESLDTIDLFNWIDEMRKTEDENDYTEYHMDQYTIEFAVIGDYYDVIIYPND